MTKEDAIKYLQQLYPNGGHCWLDEQRIEAISMAINALQEEPVSEQNLSNVERTVKNWKEPVSEELDDAANDYGLNIRKGYPRVMDETDRYICNTFKDGAKWQKEHLALTWEDIRDICRMWIESKTPFGVTGEALSIEVLNRFNKQKVK